MATAVASPEDLLREAALLHDVASSELADLCGVTNAAHGAMVEVVGDALDHDAWTGSGILSPRHWVCWQTGMTDASASDVVRLATRRRELACTVEALRNGRLSLASAGLIARYVPTDYELAVLDLAFTVTVRQLRRAVSRYHFDLDNPDPQPPPPDDPGAGTDRAGNDSPTGPSGPAGTDSPAGAGSDGPAGAGGAGPDSPAGTDSPTGAGGAGPSGDGGDSTGPDDTANDPGNTSPTDDPANPDNSAGPGAGAGAGPGTGGGGANAMFGGRLLRGSEPIEERRDLSCGSDDHHNFWLNTHLPADEGAVVRAALQARRDDLYRQACKGLPDDAPRPKITLADALVSIAETALAGGNAAMPGTDRYLVHAHLTATPAGGNDLQLHLGATLPHHLRQLYTCDCNIRPVLETNGIPANIGRLQHIVSRRLRRLIEHRDGGCTTPGCPRTTGLEIHHIIHWEHGGYTTTDNLITLCRHHHRAHHLGLLHITGNADHPHHTPQGVNFTDRWGHPLKPASTPTPTNPHQSPRTTAEQNGLQPHQYKHALGEPVDYDAIVFNDNQTMTRYGWTDITPPRPPDTEPDPPPEHGPTGAPPEPEPVPPPEPDPTPPPEHHPTGPPPEPDPVPPHDHDPLGAPPEPDPTPPPEHHPTGPPPEPDPVPPHDHDPLGAPPEPAPVRPADHDPAHTGEADPVPSPAPGSTDPPL